MAVVFAVVTGDLPLLWADWLVLEAEVLVAGELGGCWPGALVMAARRPSGFVPYCTGWNNLIRGKSKSSRFVKISILQYHVYILEQNICGSPHHVMLLGYFEILLLYYIANLMGFIGHCLGRGGGSGPV